MVVQGKLSWESFKKSAKFSRTGQVTQRVNKLTVALGFFFDRSMITCTDLWLVRTWQRKCWPWRCITITKGSITTYHPQRVRVKTLRLLSQIVGTFTTPSRQEVSEQLCCNSKQFLYFDDRRCIVASNIVDIHVRHGFIWDINGYTRFPDFLQRF